jgi:hypothetical protein
MVAGGDFVILVDSNDASIGLLDKIEVHRRGTLHRAFSVSINDGAGRLLLREHSPNTTLAVYGRTLAVVIRDRTRRLPWRRSGDLSRKWASHVR